jgi:soluble lytic murein transglycosylase-like protein
MTRKLFVCLLMLMHGFLLFPEVYGREGSKLLKVQHLEIPGAFFRSAMMGLSEIVTLPDLHPDPSPAEPVSGSATISDFAYSRIVIPLARKHGVDWKLVASVIQAESGFNPRAVSNRGAIGLMQVMPNTAALYEVKESELYNPRKNIEAGVKHLRMLTDRYKGDLEKIIAAYNSGEGNVDRYRGIPPYQQTRNFVRKVLNGYNARSK